MLGLGRLFKGKNNQEFKEAFQQGERKIQRLIQYLQGVKENSQSMLINGEVTEAEYERGIAEVESLLIEVVRFHDSLIVYKGQIEDLKRHNKKVDALFLQNILLQIDRIDRQVFEATA